MRCLLACCTARTPLPATWFCVAEEVEASDKILVELVLWSVADDEDAEEAEEADAGAPVFRWEVGKRLLERIFFALAVRLLIDLLVEVDAEEEGAAPPVVAVAADDCVVVGIALSDRSCRLGSRVLPRVGFASIGD